MAVPQPIGRTEFVAQIVREFEREHGYLPGSTALEKVPYYVVERMFVDAEVWDARLRNGDERERSYVQQRLFEAREILMEALEAVEREQRWLTVDSARLAEIAADVCERFGFRRRTRREFPWAC